VALNVVVPAVPERGWRLATSAFVWCILLAGAVPFILYGSDWNFFLALWFAAIGLAAMATLLRWRVEIVPHSPHVVRACYLLGVIPVYSRSYRKADFKCAKRSIARATGYDSGGKGIYRPSIFLVGHDNKELKIQEFADCGDTAHGLSETWAQTIAQALLLPSMEKIESWTDV
jgi:hypothetical protein